MKRLWIGLAAAVVLAACSRQDPASEGATADGQTTGYPSNATRNADATASAGKGPYQPGAGVGPGDGKAGSASLPRPIPGNVGAPANDGLGADTAVRSGSDATDGPSDGQRADTGRIAGERAARGATGTVGSVAGTVRTVRDGEIVVSDRFDAQQSLTLQPNTSITRAGQRISANEIRAGEQVRASFRNEDGRLVATEIRVSGAGERQGRRDAGPSRGEQPR